MNDDDSCALDALLRFVYTGQYNLQSWADQTPKSDMDDFLVVRFHTEVLLLADKYDVPDLKEFAAMGVRLAAARLPAVEA